MLTIDGGPPRHNVRLHATRVALDHLPVFMHYLDLILGYTYLTDTRVMVRMASPIPPS